VAQDPVRSQPLAGGQLQAAISNALVHLYREYLGRGPNRARTTLRDDVLVVIMEDTLTTAERSLVRDGKESEVLGVRESFQRTMRADMVAAVEGLSGRTVIAFMSSNHIDPDLAAETFVLAPALTRIDGLEHVVADDLDPA
jgi:uncharacterized protein YbcI